MTSPNPQSYNNEEERKRRAVAEASVGFGWVTDHHPKVNEVTVQPFGMPHSFQANVAVEMDGSLAIPDEAASQQLRAIYARFEGEKPVVLGFFYDSEIHNLPKKQNGDPVTQGERIVGHQYSKSHILFEGKAPSNRKAVVFGKDKASVEANGEDGSHTTANVTVDATDGQEKILVHGDDKVLVEQENTQTTVEIGKQGDITINTDGKTEVHSKENVIIDSNQTVKIGDETGTYKPIARKGDSVEVTGVASGSTTQTGTITEGSTNSEST